jgi:hypothetical protein
MLEISQANANTRRLDAAVDGLQASARGTGRRIGRRKAVTEQLLRREEGAWRTILAEKARVAVAESKVTGAVTTADSGIIRGNAIAHGELTLIASKVRITDADAIDTLAISAANCGAVGRNSEASVADGRGLALSSSEAIETAADVWRSAYAVAAANGRRI